MPIEPPSTELPTTQRHRAAAPSTALLLTTVASSLIALVWVLILRGRSIPVGDGGLWYVVTQRVLSTSFSLPTQIIFNGSSQPFSYPPLAAYLLAALHSVTGYEIALLMTWLPLTCNLLAIAAYAYFVSRYFKERPYAQWAAVLFPVTLFATPMFFTGAAVSRSPGLVLQLLSWGAACAKTRSRGQVWRRRAMLGSCLAGAILSHPNAGLWAVAGVTFLRIFEERLTTRDLLWSTAFAAPLVLPWLLLTLAANGPAPFVNAFLLGSEEMWGGWRSFGSPHAFLPPGGFYGACGLVGISLLVRSRYLLAPLLLLLGLLIDHRGLFALHGVTLTAMAIAPLGHLIFLHCDSATSRHEAPKARALGVWLMVLSLAMPFAVSLGSVFLTHQHGPTQLAEVNATAAEIRAATQPSDRILFLRAIDVIEHGEWLATLGERRIFPLPQAQEWTGTYADNIDLLNDLSRCCVQGSWSCVGKRLSKTPLREDFVVAIDRESCSGLLPALLEESGTVIGAQSTVISRPHFLKILEAKGG